MLISQPTRFAPHLLAPLFTALSPSEAATPTLLFESEVECGFDHSDSVGAVLGLTDDCLQLQ